MSARSKARLVVVATSLLCGSCGDDGTARDDRSGAGGAGGGASTATSSSVATGLAGGPGSGGGSGGGGGGVEPAARVRFFVDARPHDPESEEIEVTEARYTDPIRVVVSGVSPGAPVEIDVESGDGRSRASFVADDEGVVDLGRDAPIEGSWTGPDADGFLWSLDGPAGLDVRVDVRGEGGDVVATSTLVRFPFLSRGVTAEIVDAGTLVGTLYRPPGEGPFPAVMVFGGSEGGRETGEFLAAYVATLGYVALGVAYFGEAGLPGDLTDVPIEILEGDVAFLRAQPEVDPARVGLWGGSRGGELALILASRDTDLRAVVAEVPSGYVWGSAAALDRAAWTVGGEELPYVPSSGSFGESYEDEDGLHYVTRSAYFDDIDAADPGELEAARSRVEDSNASFLFVAGDDDQLWPSCDLADVAMSVLESTGHVDDHGDELHCYASAGHAIGLPGSSTIGLDEAYLPELDAFLVLGGTPAGTARAQRDANTAMRAFLERALGE